MRVLPPTRPSPSLSHLDRVASPPGNPAEGRNARPGPPPARRASSVPGSQGGCRRPRPRRVCAALRAFGRGRKARRSARSARPGRVGLQGVERGSGAGEYRAALRYARAARVACRRGTHGSPPKIPADCRKSPPLSPRPVMPPPPRCASSRRAAQKTPQPPISAA